MPIKGENPITSYFPRVTPNSKLKTPIQAKPKLAKRARLPDETDSGRESSHKKSKSRKEKDEEDFDYQPSPSKTSRVVPSNQRRSVKKASSAVIEIVDTPPSGPVKPISLHYTTPPSSPLPDLTPSPELPPRIRSPSCCHVDEVADDCEPGPSYRASMEASYPERQQVEFELIPSSQTQTLETFFYDEDTRVSQTTGRPASGVPFTRGLESRVFPPNPSHTPPSQSDTASSNPRASPDEFIASSQSQLLDLCPTSPIDPDLELIPSSQSQELSYSQAFVLRPFRRVISTTRERRTSLMDCYTSEPQARPQSTVLQGLSEGEPPISQDTETGPVPDQDSCHSPAIPSSQTPTPVSRPSSPHFHDERHVPSSQPSEHQQNDSYESLPDAVKEFSEMFSGTYESYPPDFPMSLRL
ncbi:hypothetical protein P691DRAFT_772506 [Macrolepiota fuliginosa MF-IS2]|uniref:Uncharacterized protein n=1 Tax=Macrolepiota fuliginosa MF-IS2 TaxID=1400762 RepID=A0A9P5XKM9_9AGAR|nr:hypothetical protein P691DRAFT_772506 [Macrolepiota fuliginosa MF-IS2]